MRAEKPAETLEKTRTDIARKVRELRQERHWTQAELSSRLQLSQNRLSEIERGASSFTAEQFLTILKLFNVPVNHFSQAAPNQTSELQNALARLGALHLQENAEVLPSERLEKVGDVLRETLVAAEYPRLITALGPVLVRHVDSINLKKLEAQLAEAGLARRLAWLIDNTLEALRRELQRSPPRRWGQLYRRAEIVLGTFVELLTSDQRLQAGHSESTLDLLDTGIRSKKTLEEVRASSSSISRRWGIVTTLQPEDFLEALRGARAARR
jgi:transcriptional regulator with XRE-family HTH domain